MSTSENGRVPDRPDFLLASAQGKIEALAAWHAVEAQRHTREWRELEAIAATLAQVWGAMRRSELNRETGSNDNAPDKRDLARGGATAPLPRS